MKKFSIILLLMAILLQGCASYRQVELADVEFGKVKMKGFTQAEIQVTLKVDNPTRSTFFITSLDGTINNAGTEFARFALAQEISVPPGKPAIVPAKITAEVADPLALLSKGLNLNTLKNEKFTVDALLQIRRGKIRKNFRIKDVPLKQLLQELNLQL